MAGARTDGRVERGNQTRRTVLARTMDIASVEGLEGLSIGRIATELGLSKSGVFALFGSKEELQLATIRAARAVFADRVARPAAAEAPGPGRIWRLCTAYLEYSRDRVFAGGCFFAAVSAEFGARSGPVRDAIAAARAEWGSHVTEIVEEARLGGGLRADTDARQLAFELMALLEMANADSTLHGDQQGYARAATGVRDRLRAAASDPAALAEIVG
ncbi:TetR/AcrR family transcriptional regulator [Streptomyces sp. NPDC127098]|uniref:TetR/AcrR family transcriptional regulator n=1 Tax=Streptomyces sp. NPDC127098 TaxID=3347137 RepID=UPI0036674F0E